MNLEESNSFMQEEEKKEKKKRAVVASIVLCTLLIILLIMLIMLIKYKDSQKLKMYINGKQQEISPSLLLDIDGERYINVEQIAKKLGYTYTQGGYEQYNEDPDSCYLSNEYEIVALTADETTYTKHSEGVSKLEGKESTIAEMPITVKSETGETQKYSMEKPIKLTKTGIYVPLASISEMFNTQVNMSNEKRIRINSLEQIVVNAKATITKLNYTEMSSDYENLKAIVYGLAVVGDGENYGVISLRDGSEILGLKYEDITFLPNLQNFLIKTKNTVGIFASDGSTVIKPTEYDEISVYDEENQLYLVTKEDKYGILNRLGKVIVYPDYDQIGFSTSKSRENSTNSNNNAEYKILFNKCIPVKEGTKYGLYSIDGKELLPTVYDSLGCILASDSKSNSDTTNSNEKSVVEIPPAVGIKGIVINQNDMYGVFDVTTENIIIPCSCSKVYSITRTSKTTYYLEYNEEQINLEEYLDAQGLKNVKEDDNKTKKEENTNTVNTNTTSDTNTVSEETSNVDVENTVSQE